MLERLFSLGGMVVLPCWVLLAVAPRWRWTQRLATFVAPLLRVPYAGAGRCVVQFAVCAAGGVDSLPGL